LSSLLLHLSSSSIIFAPLYPYPTRRSSDLVTIRPPLIRTDMCSLPRLRRVLCIRLRRPLRKSERAALGAALVPVRRELEGMRGAENGGVLEAAPDEGEPDGEAVDEPTGDADDGEAEAAPRRVERDQRLA